MEPLGARVAGGATAALDRWSVDSEHGRMHDVLLGDPAEFRRLGIENASYSALVRDTCSPPARSSPTASTPATPA